MNFALQGCSPWSSAATWLGYLNVEPQLDPVRADPRFQDLLHRVGLIA